MDFTQPWDFGDVNFIVEGKKIYMNKGVLALSSEVFRAMFTGEFKEKKMTEIPLPDKKFDDFLQLMRILQPVSNKCVDDTNVDSLLHLAHEYQIHHVVKLCEKVLVKQPPSIHNLILADKFSLTELRKSCIGYVKEVQYNKLEDDPEFKMVDKDTVAEVIQHKLRLHEGKDPLKNVVRRLWSEPPSIKNLFLAQEYDVPEGYEKCLKYLKDIPLSQLKNDPQFMDIKPGTLVDVLIHKCETVVTDVSNITRGKINQQGFCTDTSYRKHNKGELSVCSACDTFKVEEICKIIKKC